MNGRAILRVLGFIILVTGVAMLPCLLVAWIDGSRDVTAFLASAAAPILLGITLLAMTPGAADLRVRDGFAVVTFGWIAAACFGAMPFYLSHATNLPGALFESMSGFTTTGSSVIADVESLSHALLLWRSAIQWMGGMGIVVLSIAVLPLLGVGGMQLFKAEVPGPTTDRLTPRIQSAATALWVVYLGITVAETVFLRLGGMGWFGAICHSFTTVSTGGFSTRNTSIAAYNSAYIETVVIVFMFLSGINFSLHLGLRRLRIGRFLRDEEVRLYTVIVILAIAALTVSLMAKSGETLGMAIRHAAFQTVSILTTTGFATADFHIWGHGAQILLFFLMFLGACAGSTAGGAKLMRVIILARNAFRTARQEVHPRGIYRIRYNGQVIPDDIVMRIQGFFLLYIFIFLFMAVCLGAMGVDPETALGASIATLSNIGPGLGEVGPASTFASIPDAGKILLFFNMLLGRLELYTVLVLFMPMFWRRGS